MANHLLPKGAIPRGRLSGDLNPGIAPVPGGGEAWNQAGDSNLATRFRGLILTRCFQVLSASTVISDQFHSPLHISNKTSFDHNFNG